MAAALLLGCLYPWFPFLNLHTTTTSVGIPMNATHLIPVKVRSPLVHVEMNAASLIDVRYEFGGETEVR